MEENSLFSSQVNEEVWSDIKSFFFLLQLFAILGSLAS